MKYVIGVVVVVTYFRICIFTFKIAMCRFFLSLFLFPPFSTSRALFVLPPALSLFVLSMSVIYTNLLQQKHIMTRHETLNVTEPTNFSSTCRLDTRKYGFLLFVYLFVYIFSLVFSSAYLGAFLVCGKYLTFIGIRTHVRFKIKIMTQSLNAVSVFFRLQTLVRST